MKAFSSPALEALAAGDVIVSAAVWLETSPEPVAAWGGHGDLVLPHPRLAGEYVAFTGIGDRGLVTASAGTLGGAEQAAEVVLAADDPEVFAGLDLTVLRNVPAVIWRLVFDGSGTTLLQASVFLRGKVDDAPLVETPGGDSRITVTIEGAARGLGRRSARMRTDADQRTISATDGGLRRVSHAGEKVIYAGGKPPVRAGAAIGGVTAGNSGGYAVGRVGGGDLV